MLWIKLMGSAAVLLAGGMFSLLSVKREKDRLLALEGWMELINWRKAEKRYQERCMNPCLRQPM